MITLEPILIFAGIIFALVALYSLGDRNNPKRLINGLFYGLLALSLMAGSHLSDLINGFLALGLIILGGLIGLGRSKAEAEPSSQAARPKPSLWVFLPALIVPLTALMGTVFFKDLSLNGQILIAPKAATLVWLYLGIGLGLIIALGLFKAPLSQPIIEGRRLMDTVGWALILPQMLAALGAVFTLSGVGTEVGRLLTTYLPLSAPQLAVLVFGLGMVVFTLIMGNAFAAFPVMMTAIGLPLVVKTYGGDVVALSSLGMLTGFCGTLLTPMAANFNLVPAALLSLKDRYGVIKAQAPTAILLLIVNLALLAFCVFPKS